MELARRVVWSGSMETECAFQKSSAMRWQNGVHEGRDVVLSARVVHSGVGGGGR
jgi:hypothetical protein